MSGAGELLVRASVWLALIGYLAGALDACAPGLWGPRGSRIARVGWTVGLAAFLVHVASAFHVHYAWSHHVALQETARQTAESTGSATGFGLYLNYLFTLVWGLDVAWSWSAREPQRRRRAWVVAAIHGFMFFMVLNGSVVFGSGFVRVLGGLICLTLFAAWGAMRLRRRRP